MTASDTKSVNTSLCANIFRFYSPTASFVWRMAFTLPLPEYYNAKEAPSV